MKKFIGLILAMVMVVSISGCNTTPKEGGEETPAADVLDEVNPEDATVSKIDEIKKAGKIVMLTEATFPPFEYINGGEIVGIDPEIGKAIADKLGVKLEIVDMNFDLLPEAVNSNKGDFVAAGFTIKEELKEAVDFSNPYVDTSLYIIIPADSDAKSLEDLAGKKISVQEATTGDYMATDDIDTDDENVLRFKSAVEAGNAVSNGNSDAAILDKLPAEIMIKNSNGAAKLMDGVFKEEKLAMIVKKGNDDLLEFINTTIAELEADGKIQEFVDYHIEASKED